MGAFARAMDRLAEWVRWLAEAVRLLKPRQSPQHAQGVLEAFLKDVPVDERTEDELRAEGVPVDDIKDTEEREHGTAEEEVPGEQAGDEGDAGSASGADNASASVDGVVEGTGETRVGGKEGAEQAQTGVAGEDVGGEAVRTETREERLERRARQRREANEIRERLNRLMKKNRKYGGRRMSVEVPEAAYSAQKFSTEDVGNDILDVMDLLAQSKDATIQSNELGEVIYPFGRMGKRGMGFLHIIERRMAQGHTLDEAIEIAFRVGEAAARGSETIPENKNMRNKKWIDKNGYRAIVAIDSTQRPIITGYDIDDGETRNHSSARRRLEGYAPNPHVSSEEVVAALKRIITDIREKRKGVKFSTETDWDYLRAVEMNDLATAQHMVLEAARRAGYTIEAYHGVRPRHKDTFFGFTTMDFERMGGMMFAGSLPIARTYSGLWGETEIDRKIDESIPKRLNLKKTYTSQDELFQDLKRLGAAVIVKNIVYLRSPYGQVSTVYHSDWYDDPTAFARSLEESYNKNMERAETGTFREGNYHLALKMENPLIIQAQEEDGWNSITYNGETKSTYGWAKFAKENGHDSVVIVGLLDKGKMGEPAIKAEGLDEKEYHDNDPDLKVYIVFGEDQVKSLDPVVRDDDGNVIPLSKRFNPAHPDIRYSTEKPGEDGLSATVRSVREALRRDGDKAVELLGGTILSNYVREETDAALRKRVARAAVENLFNVVPVSEERLRQAGLIEETLALPEDEDEVASEYEDAKIVDARNRLAHGGVLVGESQAEAVVRARAKQVLGKTFRYLFEVYHGTPHAGWTRWERGHGGTTGLGYAYFAPRVITAAEYADTSEAPNKGLADVKDMQRYGLSEAVYHMVVGMNNPLIVDCRRASWNNIRMKNKRTVRTDEILNVARFGELGYDGVIFLNVHDSQLSVKLHGYDVDVDLTEVTVTTRSRAKESPPTIPLSAAVEQVAIHQGAGYSPSTEDTIAQNLPGVKFSTGEARRCGMSATVRNVQETLRGYWTT